VRRAFWVASSVIVLDEVLFAAIAPLLPVYVHRFHLSASQAGLLMAAYPALLLVSGLPGGMLVQRVGERRVLIAGTAALALLTLAYAGASTLWELWAVRAAQGALAGVTLTAGMALIANSASAGRRGQTIGIAFLVQGAGSLGGPAFGGLLAPAFGERAAFMLLAGCALAVFAVTIAVPFESPRSPATARARQLALQLVRSGAIRAGATLMLTVGLVSGAAITLAPLTLHALGLSTGAIGVVFIIGAAAGVATAPLAGRLADQGDARRIGGVLVLLASAGVALLAVPGPALLAGAAFVSVKALMYLVGTLGYTSASAHGTSFGPGFGLGLSAWAAGAIVGPITAGAIADAASRSVALIAFAALALPLARLAALPRSAQCAV
jgi:MFS family permease